MIRGMAIIAVLLLLALPACNPAPTPPAPASVSERYPIDGVIDFAALPGTREQTVTFWDRSAVPQPHHQSAVRWAMVNDDRDVYCAVEWQDDDENRLFTYTGGFIDYDSVHLFIDSNRDGIYSEADDLKWLIAASSGSFYVDSMQRSITGGLQTDIVGDGCAFMRYHAGRGVWQAEFLIPLADDANGQDANITSATPFTLFFSDHISGGDGFYALLTDDWTATASWPRFPITDPGSVLRPTPPADLAGLVVFISTHETAKGGIYTFDPATRAVTRIRGANPAVLDALWVDTISLSPDRQWVAFMGSPLAITEPGGFGSVDVYVMRLDGTGLRNLTNTGGVLDGHPAWSPDGRRLVFARYTQATAHLILADAGGTTLADLTILSGGEGSEENDPEWTPDGRIVYKTSRFNGPGHPFPELRIAVMNDDGSAARVLTTLDGVVDHDPWSDGTTVLFERLTGPWDYVTDERALTSPWNIVEARMDGSGERTLVGNVFVNWLPVADPSGRCIAHLRNSAIDTQEARLISRDGTVDYGRFIPGITRLRYLDWK